MATLSLTLPPRLLEALEREAKVRGVDHVVLAQECLEHAFKVKATPEAKTTPSSYLQNLGRDLARA